MFERPEVRRILSWTVQGHENHTPHWSEGEGYSFCELQKVLEQKDAATLLEELCSRGYFERYLVDTELACPKCGSVDHLRTRYSCPFCHGYRLIRATLVEHYGCGKVDLVEKFEKAGELICPKCGGKLRLIGTDYRTLQNVDWCVDCGRRSTVVNVVHLCSHCDISFDHEKAVLRPVYGYKFSENRRSEVIASCMLEASVIDIMMKKGYAIESPGSLTGKSGIAHTLDLVARSKGSLLIASIFAERKQVQAEHIVKHFAKAFDIGPERSLVIAMPRLSDEARKLAKLYGIEIVEGETATDVLNQMRCLTSEERT